MNKKEKIVNHFCQGTLFNLLKTKISFNFFNLITQNKNATTYLLQCRNYEKLKKKFEYILKEPMIIKKKKKYHSKKIWFCWLQGYENATDLVKACYNSLKINMPDYEIIFLTEKNINNYVKFPDYINKKYKNGNISKAHFSDLVRISLLCKYGGLWIDSTVLCTSSDFMKIVSKEHLFVYKQVDLIRQDIQPIVSSNWLIYAESNNEICLLTQKLLFEYWKKYNYAIDYFIFHFFFAMATEKYSDIWDSIPVFNNINPHVMQFELNHKFSLERWNQLKKYSSFHKLNNHFKYKLDGTIYFHILNEYRKNEDK